MSERGEFEAWWDRHGQFVRAGGGDYEKCFAYAAWNFRATPQQAVPEGWKLVPVEPTQSMIEAWNNSGADDFKIKDPNYSEFTDEQWREWMATNAGRDWSAMLAAAPQPSPEPKGPEHAHDWRFSLQDHVYKCDCGATRGDYPFGAASFKD